MQGDVMDAVLSVQNVDAGMLARVVGGVERVCFVGGIRLSHPPLAVTMVTPWQRPGVLPEKGAGLPA